MSEIGQFIDPSSYAGSHDYRKPVGPIAKIVAFVAPEFGLTRAELIGSDISRRVSEPRHIAIWLARQASGKSAQQIGLFLNRDHSTVCSATRHVEDRRASDDKYRALTDDLLASLPR